MVGVSINATSDVPGFLPRQLLDVDKDSHQLSNSKRRVCVIQLNAHLTIIKLGSYSYLVGEFGDVSFLPLEVLYDILQGGTNEEILLLQSQFLSR